MKLQLTGKVDALFHVKSLHHVATLLDPRLKNGILSTEEKADAMLVVRTMMSEVEEHVTDTDSKNATSEPPAEKTKVEQSSSCR